MKIVHKDLKKGEIKVNVEDMEDIWYLSHIIGPNDVIKGKTIRKIKIGAEDQRVVKIVKKHVFISIKVEKVEFAETLRVNGTVVEGPEDISRGSYHTFNIEPNTTFTIVKEKWLKYQLDKLADASEKMKGKILICVFDRETASFALVKKAGFEMLTEVAGKVQKKADIGKVESKFYEEIIQILEEYVGRYDVTTVVVASPAFFKEDLMKLVGDADLKKKIVLATCNNTGKTGVSEVLKRPEIKEALKQVRVAIELKLVEQVLEEVSKGELASYGLNEVAKAVGSGAVKVLLTTDNFMIKLRQEEKYKELDDILKMADSMKAEVYIISSEHDGGEKLDGLGGIAAILRYKLS